MTGGIFMLTSLLVAVFCGGGVVFYAVTIRRGTRAALIGWGVCGVIVVALGWSTYALDAPSRAVVFAGLILPVWLSGALLGLIIGAIRQRLRR